MKIRLGLLRSYLREALLFEEAMTPGRWYGGEEPEGWDRERVGDPLGMDETDARMEGDGLGPTQPDPNEEVKLDIADHLRGDEEKISLGNAPDETMEESLANDIRSYFLQEGPAGAGVVDPREPKGFYTSFDMTKDHTGTDDLSATWYRSPGRQAGGDGDPFRSSDPHAQLGFHPPKAQNDPVASPPAADGETGVAARLAPPIWQLSAGGDTSKVLGAGAKPDTGGGESGDESEKSETGTGAEGEGGKPGAEDEEAEGKEPRAGDS